MQENTELGEVILGASYVDELLGELILTRCIDDEVTRKMFDPDDPSRSFDLASKAKWAFCLGLISRKELNHIKQLMRTRNKVAHETVAGLFESVQYRKILKQRFPSSAGNPPSH